MTANNLVSRFVKTILLGAFVASISIASAHTGLRASTPANQATVDTPPAEINLVFTGPVRLVKVELVSAGEVVPTEFKPAAEAVAEYVIATPSVKSGNYTVNWAAIGADGHTVSNSFSFVVSANASTASL